MNDKKIFCLLFPSLTDAHVTKDVCLIPYIMQKYLGYHSVIATYKASGGTIEWPSLQLLKEDIEIDPITSSFYYEPQLARETVFTHNMKETSLDMCRYIQTNAYKIDVLYLFGFYEFYFDAVNLYKQINPSGKVYLKLDANISWINSLEVDTRFSTFLKNCDLVTSETLIKHLNSKWPIPVYYLPNGYYSLNEEENHLLRLYSYTQKENIIFTAGRIGSRQKSTPTLIEAFQKAAPYITSDWKLVLAGEIEESFQDYLENFKNIYPELADRIITLGFVNDKKILSEWFQKSKIFALPSLYEGYANVLAESKVYGCYFIGSDIESSRDAISNVHGSNITDFTSVSDYSKTLDYGTLHDIGDSSELADILIKRCNDEKRLEEVCYKTQQDAIEHFDWIKLCEKINFHLKISS